MEEQAIKRKLATILAADVAGYSRLMGEDEEATLRTLEAYLEVIDGVIARHGGRIFGRGGDSVVAEFVSPVEAVRCAVGIQTSLGARNADLPKDRRMLFRIGINLDDVMIEGDNLLGDGVNLAARLQEMAEPGGVDISGSVFDRVNPKLDLTCEDLGERHVKNIAKPVRVYRVQPSTTTAGTVGPARTAHARFLAWGVFLILAVSVGAAVGTFYLGKMTPTEVAGTRQKVGTPLLAGPSLAVVPFSNTSDTPEQEYFADGITEDLITDLSKFSGLFVIARSTMFAYRGRQTKAQEVAEDLGVRYVLEGSVRREGDKVRINVQLADTATETLLWAERYDGSLTDVFALQDDITRKIIAALAVELPKREESLRRRAETKIAEAYDAFLVGWSLYRRGSRTDLAKAVSFLREAIALDPKFARAHAALAATYWDIRLRGWEQSIGLSAEESAKRAEEHLSLAKENPSPLAHQVASRMLSFQGRHEEAIAEAERAIALDASDPASFEAMVSAQRAAGNTFEGPYR